MARPGLSLVRRMRTLLGSDAAVTSDRAGLVYVAPPTPEGIALVLEAASNEGWQVRVAGQGHWAPPDAPADLTLSTSALTRVTQLDAADLVATVDGGLGWEALRLALADRGTWIAADPPGLDRSVGSVVATGTSGPLRTGFGAIRDQLLGVTLVTGHGRIVRPGGRVVKNVAGFDLTRLVAGSFGAFGVIASATFRLRAVPRSDVTVVAPGGRDQLAAGALAILAAGLTPAALEVLSPVAAGSDGWVLAVRLTGSEAAVRHERDVVTGTAPFAFRELARTDASRLWRTCADGALSDPVTLRLGTLPSAVDEAFDLIEHHLPESWLAASIGAAATVRWSGDAPADRLRLLRYAAAQREMPVTIERAPWSVLSPLGHFGAYREGVGRLVHALKQSFDPANVLVTATEGR